MVLIATSVENAVSHRYVDPNIVRILLDAGRLPWPAYVLATPDSPILT